MKNIVTKEEIYERLHNLFIENESKIKNFASSLDKIDLEYLSSMFIEGVYDSVFSIFMKFFKLSRFEPFYVSIASEAIKEILREKELEYSSIMIKQDYIIVSLKNPYEKWRY